MLRACALVALLAGCKASGTFACERNDQCTGTAGGRCEPDGFCSFPDGTCMSGFRFDEFATAGLAGTCVGEVSTSDTLGDAPAICMTWVAVLVEPCSLPAPGPDVHLMAASSPYTYDTTTGGGRLTDKDNAEVAVTATVLQQLGNLDAAVISTTKFEIDAGVELRVIGDKPLIVAAFDAITIAGTVDAGSRSNRTGAGANPSDCATRAGGNGADGVSGNGGGGGGGNAAAGGIGGNGDANCTPSPPTCERAGGAAGTATTAAARIAGGCPGGNSGLSGGVAALGGAGGGGIGLVALNSISITGTVAAGGAGGGGDPNASVSTGGGGGGSGGTIGLDCASITITGTLAANGGAGGGGADIANLGGRGGDGAPAVTAATGGSAIGGSAGGVGSSQSSLAGGVTPGPVGNGGGGGGGGAAGFILHWGASYSEAGVISPPSAPGP